MYVIIFVLKSFSFQLLLGFVRSDFRLYFVSVLRNISVSVFVSVNIISISVSVSVNEYITDPNTNLESQDKSRSPCLMYKVYIKLTVQDLQRIGDINLTTI